MVFKCHHLITDAQRKEAVMAQVRAEVQAANAKELLESLTDKCYMKCVTKPGTSLSSSEEVRV
jgi:mitochondrial import inner membrane translocase subunit TIM13